MNARQRRKARRKRDRLQRVLAKVQGVHEPLSMVWFEQTPEGLQSQIDKHRTRVSSASGIPKHILFGTPPSETK